MKPKHRNENLIIQEANNETLVYDLGINKAYLLNETSSFIWQMCDGKTETSEIATALSKKFKKAANEDYVWLAIDGLKNEGLMANAGELPYEFIANRREAIKKIGLATMITLPLVTSLIAPTAANAQSGTTGFANCQTCNVNSDCSSNNCVEDASANLFCAAVGVTLALASGSRLVFRRGTCQEAGAVNCCSGTAQIDPDTGNCFCT